ncbi:hypothetical protein FV219_09215, partial [Methylobacterium sp. WL122]
RLDHLARAARCAEPVDRARRAGVAPDRGRRPGDAPDRGRLRRRPQGLRLRHLVEARDDARRERAPDRDLRRERRPRGHPRRGALRPQQD